MTKHEKAMHEKLVLQNAALERNITSLEESLKISDKYYLEELGKSKAYLIVIKELVKSGGMSSDRYSDY